MDKATKIELIIGHYIVACDEAGIPLLTAEAVQYVDEYGAPHGGFAVESELAATEATAMTALVWVQTTAGRHTEFQAGGDAKLAWYDEETETVEIAAPGKEEVADER